MSEKEESPCDPRAIANELITRLEKRVDELNELEPRGWSFNHCDSPDKPGAIVLQESGIRGHPFMPCRLFCDDIAIAIHQPSRGEILTIKPSWDQEKGECRMSVGYVLYTPRKSLPSISLDELWVEVQKFLKPLFPE